MFYLLNKEKGISSFNKIKNFAKKNKIQKIGHTGTLDPLASGLLIVATNEDTKLIRLIDRGWKSYIVEIEFGKISNTYDSEGEVKNTKIKMNESKIIKTIKSYVKTYNQIPPNFSAKKINGKRAYELARNNKEVNLKPNKVTIKKIKKIKKIEKYKYKFEVEVSRGTYIRSIVHEIGQDLKCGAIMTSLVRNKISNLKFKNLGIIKYNKIIHIPSFKIKKEIKKFMDGKEIKVNKKEGEFIVLFKKEIIGTIKIKNKKIISRKIFGKRVERIINESNNISK